MLKIGKKYLLLLAGIVWLAAGINILRIGLLSYGGYVTVLNILLSLAVFMFFWLMIFSRMVRKHTGRITGYQEEKQFFLKFFDVKSFIIMACMISLGIGHLPPGVYRGVLHRLGNRAGSGRRPVYVPFCSPVPDFAPGKGRAPSGISNPAALSLKGSRRCFFVPGPVAGHDD